MEAPEKIYINCRPISPIGFFALNNEKIQGIDYNVEYIRKDVVDDMLKTAEDHAYFAGSEAMREKAINSVWHDAKEPPEIRRKYLVRYNDGRVNGSWERYTTSIPWKDVVKEHHFAHWCYVDDLLPKDE